MFRFNTLFTWRLILLLGGFWLCGAFSPASAADASSGDGQLPGTPAVKADNDPAPVPSDHVSIAETPGAIALAANTPESPAAPSDPPASSDATKAAAPSENVTINLIHLMVKRGLITKDDAANLIKQAEDEALAAHEQAIVAQASVATPSASGPASNETSPVQVAGAAPVPATPVDGGDDTVRVTYVPDVVKQQLREEVTRDVMADEQKEKFGPDTQIPDWVRRFHVTGDIRVRTEGDFFPGGNDDFGDLENYSAINTGSGLDVNLNNLSKTAVPTYDTDQDRDRLRLRARIGAGIDLGQGFTAGMRIATGQDDNPVTENQTIGLANNAQGGDFSKYAIWLDRAFINYDLWGDTDKDLSFTVGRFDNPFFSTSMIWANEIGFDGAMVKGKYEVTDGVTPFLTAGVFPVFNTDFNFSSDQAQKFPSEDKYLYAGQTGVKFKINRDFSLLSAVAVYDFENIEGKLSDPIVPGPNEAGNTDDSRPSFQQNGNTMMELRNYEPLASVGDTTPELQYFGLASKFRELSFTNQLDFGRFDPFHMSLVGEFVKNLSFDRDSVATTAFNNRNADGNFGGGDSGYYVGLTVGQVALEKLGDWNVNLNYRYVQTDAVVDGFTDADFGGDLTGTNLKGYTVQGNVALNNRVFLRLNWMSADAIEGPIFRSDLIMFDINAKF